MLCSQSWPQTHDSPPASAFQLDYKYISSCLALSFLFNGYIQPSLSHHGHENSRSRGKITFTVRCFPIFTELECPQPCALYSSSWGQGFLLCSVIVLVSQFSYHLWVASICWSSKQKYYAWSNYFDICIDLIFLKYIYNARFSCVFVHQHAYYKLSDNSSSCLENHPWLATKYTSNIYTYIMVPGFLCTLGFQSVNIATVLGFQAFWIGYGYLWHIPKFNFPSFDLAVPLTLHSSSHPPLPPPFLLPSFLLYCCIGRFVELKPPYYCWNPVKLLGLPWSCLQNSHLILWYHYHCQIWLELLGLLSFLEYLCPDLMDNKSQILWDSNSQVNKWHFTTFLFLWIYFQILFFHDQILKIERRGKKSLTELSQWFSVCGSWTHKYHQKTKVCPLQFISVAELQLWSNNKIILIVSPLHKKLF